MLGRTGLVAVAALVALAAVTTAVEHHRVTQLQSENADLALKVTNDSAVVAKTVVVSQTNAKLAALFGDSLKMYQKAVVQVAQQSDAIDKALKLERRAKYALSVSLDSLHRRIASRSAVTEDTTDHVRRASFDVRQAPYTITAEVELPPAPDTAHLDLRIALDPVPVVARLSCAPPNEHGIRTASIEAATPAWASLKFDDVQQSPDLCASPALTHASGHPFVRLRPVVGVGRIFQPDGTSRWGGFVGAGFAFGG